jgi:UDP:flavonoid glycosyltransferase YjiC (YdhE family)
MAGSPRSILMARVLLVWELGANYGHVASLAPIAAELRRRGHQVMAALQELKDAPSFFPNDIALLQAPRPPDNQPALRRPRAFGDLLVSTGYADPGQLSTLIRAWRSLLEIVGPDVTVYDAAPTALLASRGLPIVKVAYGSGFSLPPLTTPLPALLPELALPMLELERRERQHVATINQALSNRGLRPIEALKDIFEVQATLIKSVAELDQYGPRPEADYVGPAYNLDAGAPVPWPPGRGPRVFVYLRPPAEKLESLAQRVAGTNLRMIAVIPSAQPEALARLQLPNLHASVEPVRLRKVVKTADLAICHSAVGTGAAFLLAGVPLLLLPTTLEQKMSAVRVTGCGAGLAAMEGPPNFPELLARLLREASFRRSARQFAARHACEPLERTQQVCDRIERTLALRGAQLADAVLGSELAGLPTVATKGSFRGIVGTEPTP